MSPRRRLAECLQNVPAVDTLHHRGRVLQVVGDVIEATLPNACIGAPCALHPSGGQPVPAEVVGLRDGLAILMPLGQTRGLTAGTPVDMPCRRFRMQGGPGCLGRVLDALGEPIDGHGPLQDVLPFHYGADPVNPMVRRPVEAPLATGVRGIDALLTLGAGQRIAVLAGAGVGKSTLLTMIARNTAADVSVLALIGERGSEVRKFLHELLRTPGNRERIVIVAATSDQPAALRLRAAFTATALAEDFRARGNNVLLMMDSLTRVAMAQREIGLAVGEPPATRGYPPSAFALIPKLLERAGRTARGSITGIYTTLVEGDDIQDPVGDATIATADGHIVLSRALAEQGHFPAIDIRRSLSRTMNDLVDESHRQDAIAFRRLIGDHEAAADLASLGAYRKGTNPRYDIALELEPLFRSFLVQHEDERTGLLEAREGLAAIRSAIEDAGTAHRTDRAGASARPPVRPT